MARSATKIGDTLPPASSFLPVAAGSSPNGWCANPGCPDWLYKRAEQVYFHIPTSSLWRRRNKVLVQVDAYRSALGGFASTAPMVLMRAVFSTWRQAAEDAKRWCTDDLDHIAEEPSTPDIRSAPKGLRRSRQGVSPPPMQGWSAVGQGWEGHTQARQWLRKSAEAACMGSAVFFYRPTETLWMQLPSGVFACVETYHSALATLISSSETGLSRTVFCKWRNQVRALRTVVSEWRHRIQVMATSFNDEPDAAEESEASPMPWSVQTAVRECGSGQRRQPV